MLTRDKLDYVYKEYKKAMKLISPDMVVSRNSFALLVKAAETTEEALKIVEDYFQMLFSFMTQREEKNGSNEDNG